MDKVQVLKCSLESHENEDIIAICMKKDCQFTSRLMCVSCLTSDHCDHGRYGMKVNEFNQFRDNNEIVLNWKGDNDISQKLLCGLKKFKKNLEGQTMIQELDKFESEIIQEIKILRKQLLTNINIKKEQGYEEYGQILSCLAEHLQIGSIQQLLSSTDSILDSQKKFESNQSMNEINSKLSKIIQEQNDKNSKSYQNCVNQMCNSECIYSYSLNFEVIEEEQKKIQQIIKHLLNKIQPSKAYDSLNTIKIGDNNTQATFTNLNGYSVAYLNTCFKIDQKPIQLIFKFDQALQKQHFCIGLRKDQLKDEDSYNKTPYKCLHCKIGDGIISDSGIHRSLIQNDTLIVSFIPKQKKLVIFSDNDKMECQLSIPIEEKSSDNLYRLYFWRVANLIPTTVKLIKVAQL